MKVGATWRNDARHRNVVRERIDTGFRQTLMQICGPRARIFSDVQSETCVTGISHRPR